MNINIDRRKFLKTLGGSVIASSALLGACKPGEKNSILSTNYSTGKAGKMTYRTNNKTGDKVSLLGYGCMRWPMITQADGTEVIDQEMVNELVDHAIANGVNFFDTSPVYVRGLSESATGIALSRHPRDSYFISTKLSNFSPETHSREASIAMYRKSMKNLQVDYLDYYLLHSVGDMETFKTRYLDNGLLDFLLKEKEAGRIRNLGWSFHGEKEFFDYMLSLSLKWDFILIQLNYVDWHHASGRNVNAEYLYEEMKKQDIQALVMEPLQGGRLSKMSDHLVERLKQREPELSVASWAFRFAGTHEHVLTVLSGMTYMEHLQDNLRTYSPLVSLTQEELDFLEETASLIIAYPSIPCNTCDYCMPCPYGIDIPGIFTYYNTCINEGKVASGKQDPKYRKARRAFLVGYDRHLEKVRQADHCIGCQICNEHCPQKINIPEELIRINTYVEQLKQNLDF